MTFKEINKEFTEKVAEYLANGYTINAGTMSGDQGEVAHIDLTDGTEIIRIVIDNFYDYKTFTEGLRLVVGRCTDRCRPDDESIFGMGIWNEHLDQIEEKRFVKKGRDEYVQA